MEFAGEGTFSDNHIDGRRQSRFLLVFYHTRSHLIPERYCFWLWPEIILSLARERETGDLSCLWIKIQTLVLISVSCTRGKMCMCVRKFRIFSLICYHSQVLSYRTVELCTQITIEYTFLYGCYIYHKNCTCSLNCTIVLSSRDFIIRLLIIHVTLHS